MGHSLVALKTNFKLILYGKDLESVSSILRMGHSFVPLKTNFKLILHGKKTYNRFQVILTHEFVL